MTQCLNKEQVTLKRPLEAVCKSNKSSKILLFCYSYCHSLVANCICFSFFFSIFILFHLPENIQTNSELPELVEKGYAGTIQSKVIATLSFYMLLSPQTNCAPNTWKSTKCPLNPDLGYWMNKIYLSVVESGQEELLINQRVIVP